MADSCPAGGMFSNTPCSAVRWNTNPSSRTAEALTLGVLQQYIPGRSAWQTTLESLKTYFARVMQLAADERPSAETAFQAETGKTGETTSDPRQSAGGLWAMTTRRPAAIAERLAGDNLARCRYLDSARPNCISPLGRRYRRRAIRSRAVYGETSAIAPLVDA